MGPVSTDSSPTFGDHLLPSLTSRNLRYTTIFLASRASLTCSLISTYVQLGDCPFWAIPGFNWPFHVTGAQESAATNYETQSSRERQLRLMTGLSLPISFWKLLRDTTKVFSFAVCQSIFDPEYLLRSTQGLYGVEFRQSALHHQLIACHPSQSPSSRESVI